MDAKAEITESTNYPMDLKKDFADYIIRRYALTTITKSENIDYKAVKSEAVANIAALDPKDNLQIMLASQMHAIHALQQHMMLYANATKDIATAEKCTNMVTKLSNVFIQQVNLLKKLKGEGEKKIVIEHVHVHSGGQAVVGSCIPISGNGGVKK